MADDNIQAGTPYSPGVPQPLMMEEFQGMFTSTTRPGVDEKQCWNLDGYMPIGPRMLRTMPGVGPNILSSAGNITFFDFANIGSSPVAIVFFSDGSVFQVNTQTAVSVLFAAPGTIQNPSPNSTAISQWGSQYVQIVTQQTNGYFLWDGTTFYVPGGAAPGGGTMPLAIGGNAIENYQGRAWIANGATITFSAPGSLTDFSTASGGGNFTSTDSFLRVGFTELVQTNGFLYLIGDSSINYISGVQTSGSPPVTTFTNQNADPEVGTPYPSTVDVFGRNIVFANAWGAHVSYGSAVAKISEALDGFYTSVPNFGGQILSGAKAIVFGKKLWMLLVPVIDLFTGQQVNKLLIWDGKIWWSSEQDFNLVYIQHQEINSVLTAWGTDGHSLFPLFQNPSNQFTKRVSSKMWTSPVGYNAIKNANQFYGLAQYFTLNAPNVTLYIESENAASFGGNAELTLAPSTANSKMMWTTDGKVMTWTTGGQLMIWAALSAGYVVFPVTAVGQQGVMLGFTLETNCPDMAWISTMLGIIPAAYRGK